MFEQFGVCAHLDYLTGFHHDDLIGVMLPDMIWPEDKFKAYLDSGYVRTESSKAIAVGDIADYSLLRALK